MKLDNKYHYHNLHHTKRVINSAGEIGNHYNLVVTTGEIYLLHVYYMIMVLLNHTLIMRKLVLRFQRALQISIILTIISSQISSLILITKVAEKPRVIFLNQL